MSMTVLLCLLTVFFVYKLWNRDITCPIVYYEDGVGGLLSIKNIRDGNGFFHFPSLRAPYGEYNYYQDYILPLIIINFFSLFTKSVGALSNLFWLFTYVLTACTAYGFLRRMHCQPIIALTGATIYNFLPYHYFRIEHFWLFGCYIIPLIGWIVIDILENNPSKKSINIKIGHIYLNRTLLLDLLFAILIGLNGLYYSYFAVLLFGFSGIITSIETKKIKPFLASVFYSIVTFSIVVYYMVLAGYLHDGGAALANIANTRGIADVHTYSLDIFLMFLPIPGHRINMLSSFTQQCYEMFSIHTENYQAALGLIMSLGLIISIVYMFISKRNSKNLILVKQMGILNVFIILVACIGGFGTFVSLFISSAIRCYNRASVIIALFSITTICLIANYLFDRYRFPPAAKSLLCAALCIFSIFDQTSPHFAEYSKYDSLKLSYSGNRDELDQRYKEDMEFIKNVELQIGKGKNIYFLPNEVQYNPNRIPFAKTKGYICSKTSNLNWSATILDKQYSNALSLIENNDLNTFIKCIALLDFSGIVIDKNSYYEDSLFYDKINYFVDNLNLQPYFNIGEDLCFFNISDVVSAIRQNYSSDYIDGFKNYICNITPNKFIPIDLNSFLINGTSHSSSSLELNAGDVSYGSYIELEAGKKYQLTILGSQLENLTLNLTGGQQDQTINISKRELTTDALTFEFEIDNPTRNVGIELSTPLRGAIINELVLQILEANSFTPYHTYADNMQYRQLLPDTQKIPLSCFYINGMPQNNNSFVIPKNSMQYGPYIQVEPGKYRITIKGENMQNAELQLITNLGQTILEMNDITKNSGEISFGFTTFTSISNLEVYLSNTEEDMLITEYTLKTLN